MMDMAAHDSRQVIEEPIRQSIAVLDTQAAIRGTLRELIAYSAGTRETAERVAKQRWRKQILSKERNTAKCVNGDRQELGNGHLELGCERTRMAVLLSDITNAVDGQCALPPQAAVGDPIRRPRSRQRRSKGVVAADDAESSEIVAKLMTVVDQCSKENEYLRHYVTKTKSWMKSSQQELEKLRADSVDMQQEHSKQLQDQRQQHKEQLHQQVQQHEGEQGRLQKQVEVLQERHSQETAHLRAQIVRDQADRARQDEELNLLQGLQEREDAILQAVSGLKTQTEQGIAPVAEAAKQDQARMHDALKQAELARSEHGSVLQALQDQVSAVHKQLSKSLEQNAAQKNEVSSLQEQLKQAQSELRAAKNDNAAAEQQRLFAEQQQWIAEQLKGIAGAVRPPAAPASDAAPPHRFNDTAVPAASEDPPDDGPAQHLSPQRSSMMFLSDEEPARIDAVYRSVGRLAESLRGDASKASQAKEQTQQHQSHKKRASRSQPEAPTGTQSKKQSAGGRKGKRKRSEKQRDELDLPDQQVADDGEPGEPAADVGDADASEAVVCTSAGIPHAPSDRSPEKENHDAQQPARKLRDRRPSAVPAEPASSSGPVEEPAPLARGRRRSNRAGSVGLQRRDLPRVAEDDDTQHGAHAMGPGGEHGSPPVPFGRDPAPAQAAPQVRGTAFDIWEDPASSSPLPPTLRHDGAHVGLAPAMVNTSNQAAGTQAAGTQAAAAVSAQDSRASARKAFVAPRAHKDPSSFGIVRNPSAAITSKVLQAATASRQNFRSFSWADKLAATASERVQQRKGQFSKKRGSQFARLGKCQQPPVQDMFPGGPRRAVLKQ